MADFVFFCLNKLNKQTVFVFKVSLSKLNKKLTSKDNTVSHCLTVADPATFLASITVLGKLFFSENMNKYMILYHYLNNIVNVGITV